MAAYSPYSVGWSRYLPKASSMIPVIPVIVSPPRKRLVRLNGSPLPGCGIEEGFCEVEASSIVMIRFL